ncbi:hypothetical protein I317_03953 [Kwoniella heveanensis CBS 569]|nr:hypothetical protein I317_03953 [Kwoniella heveanensis CBS 569]
MQRPNRSHDEHSKDLRSSAARNRLGSNSKRRRRDGSRDGRETLNRRDLTVRPPQPSAALRMAITKESATSWAPRRDRKQLDETAKVALADILSHPDLMGIDGGMHRHPDRKKTIRRSDRKGIVTGPGLLEGSV